LPARTRYGDDKNPAYASVTALDGQRVQPANASGKNDVTFNAGAGFSEPLTERLRCFGGATPAPLAGISRQSGRCVRPRIEYQNQRKT
jgi:hypothetical protein